MHNYDPKRYRGRPCYLLDGGGQNYFKSVSQELRNMLEIGPLGLVSRALFFSILAISYLASVILAGWCSESSSNPWKGINPSTSKKMELSSSREMPCDEVSSCGYLTHILYTILPLGSHFYQVYKTWGNSSYKIQSRCAFFRCWSKLYPFLSLGKMSCQLEKTFSLMWTWRSRNFNGCGFINSVTLGKVLHLITTDAINL